MADNRPWRHFGDVNFLQYGGVMVRKAWDDDVLQKYPTLSDEYDVFILNEYPDEEDKVYVAYITLCLSDFDESLRQPAIDCIGCVPEDDYELVYTLTEYYGASFYTDQLHYDEVCRQSGMSILTRTMAKAWMDELGIPASVAA